MPQDLSGSYFGDDTFLPMAMNVCKAYNSWYMRNIKRLWFMNSRLRTLETEKISNMKQDFQAFL